MRVLVIDNYDSFTFNLVQYLGELGAACEVVKNDALDVDGIAEHAPDGLLISPGPCTPNEAGVSLAAIRELSGKIPILGVCLGHQAIGQAFGGKVVRAERLMHGKTSPILHAGEGIFANLPSPFEATRYHSLLVERASLAAIPGGHGVDGRRRDHGPAAREPRRRRGPVPPGEHPHAGGEVAPCQLGAADDRADASGGGVSAEAAASFADVIDALLSRAPLPEGLVRGAFEAILAGAWTPVQVGAFAVALRLTGGQTVRSSRAPGRCEARWSLSSTGSTWSSTPAEPAATARRR